MKAITIIITALVLALGTIALRAANVDRVSAQTGVSIATLQAERTSTGLGWGAVENANLIANASGQSFDTIVGKFHSGEGWGKIAHDYGLNLGHLVSAAHRSTHATTHAQNTKTMHGKNTTSVHGKSATLVHGGMHSMGHIGSMGHMGGGHR
jgi:hypothetical protein